MEELKSTIKFFRVTRIPLDLREYDQEELTLAMEVICEEWQANTDNDPPLGVLLPFIQCLVIRRCDLSRMERKH